MDHLTNIKIRRSKAEVHLKPAAKKQGTLQSRCSICVETESKYTCPRCGIQYCSLECYKDDRHQDCSEGFFKKEVEEVLKSDMVETEEKKKMIEILKRDKEEREKDLLPEEMLEEDEEGDQEDFDADGDFDVEGMLAQLSKEEREMFEKALKDNSIISEISENLNLWWSSNFKVIPENAPILRNPPLLSDKLTPHWTTPLFVSNLAVVYCFIYRRYLGDPEDLVQECTDEILKYAECFKPAEESDPEHHLYSVFETIAKESDNKTALIAFYDSVEVLENKLKLRSALSHLTNLLQTKGLKSKQKKLASKKVEFYHSWVLSSEISESLSLPVKLFYLDKKREIDEFALNAEKVSSQLESVRISDFNSDTSSKKLLIDEMSMRVGWACLAALASAASFDETEADYTVIVGAGRRDCYFQPMNKGVPFEIEYQVLDGGDLDIDFMIIGPSGQVIVDEKRQEEGLHEIPGTDKGQYQICFNNMFSRMTDKTVFFEVFTEEDYDDYEYDDDDYYDDYYDDDIPVAMKQKEKKGEWKKDLVEDEATEGMLKEKVDDMIRKLVKMKTNLIRTAQFQAILRAFESKDRNILEANLKRVNNWSTIHMVVMLVAAILQVCILRSFFSSKQTAGGNKSMT
ncbi:Oidioi.mRNA.OKI2018_I69.chr1.g1722.t1.cds [Oikopleura dioica]|uniref:Oidioi.mRNA.OKI2018_I69.chr1.g1722.t1.cds n=1 Tax=Oikopleura dioica TaxID=34765 RepID=A0ABN7SSL5_OIKDI|nr:Oidioi.mRNA.OKI2018_I69.chr1.g1722.t1.cds [Oikopleura dioica]